MPAMIVVVTVAMAVVVVVVVAVTVVAAAMVATECLRKNVQEYITEHAAVGEAQQQWLCCPASKGVHVWKQRGITCQRWPCVWREKEDPNAGLWPINNYRGWISAVAC